MARKDWLALVAVHSDAWLIAVAFYYGAKLDTKAKYGPRALKLCLSSPPNSLAFLLGRKSYAQMGRMQTESAHCLALLSTLWT